MTDKSKKANSKGGLTRRLSHKAGAAGMFENPLLIWGTLAALVIVAFAVTVYLSAVSGSDTGSGGGPYVGGDLHALAVDPTDAGKVMVGGHAGTAVSENGGENWEQIEDLGGADPMGWVVNPEDPQKMYAGGHPGFFRSEDGGESWSMDNSGLPGTDVHGLGMDAQNPDTLYASIMGEGLYRSPDAGESWQLVNEEMTVMGQIPVDPRNPDTLYLAGPEGEFLKSENGGEDWEQIGKIPGGMAMSISQDRETPDTFYAAAGGSLYKSTDGGASWQSVSEGLPGNVSVVAASPAERGIVYAGALDGEQARLFRSENAGESWSARN